MKFTKPLQIQSYEKLRAMVLSDQFEPDTIYSETRIAQELGISRTPVRDAIQHLAQEGFLDIIPSKGFRLHQMTEADLLHTFQIRCALEGFCAVQLAKNCRQRRAARTIEQLEELLSLQRMVMNSSHAVSEFLKYDLEFHQQLVSYLENDPISELFSSIQYRIDRMAARTLKTPGRMEETLREHQAIVDFMKAGEAARTYEAVMTHLERPIEIIEADGV